LAERRVTVVAPGLAASSAGADLVPVAEVRRVVIGNDHTGLALKHALVEHLRGRGLQVLDVGTRTGDAVDYPDIAAAVALAVSRGEADAGIVIDGAGIGSAIAANKIRGIRAAVCNDQTLARYSREHNGANVSRSATLLGPEAAIALFLSTR
jgi:ribose 5-phosphate isomerase B